MLAQLKKLDQRRIDAKTLELVRGALKVLNEVREAADHLEKESSPIKGRHRQTPTDRP